MLSTQTAAADPPSIFIQQQHHQHGEVRWQRDAVLQIHCHAASCPAAVSIGPVCLHKLDDHLHVAMRVECRADAVLPQLDNVCEPAGRAAVDGLVKGACTSEQAASSMPVRMTLHLPQHTFRCMPKRMERPLITDLADPLAAQCPPAGSGTAHPTCAAKPAAKRHQPVVAPACCPGAPQQLPGWRHIRLSQTRMLSTWITRLNHA